MSTANVPIAVKIDHDLKMRMVRLAGAKRRTTHWLMREAISQYVEREEKREAFYEYAEEAWAEYQKTGLHVNAEEVITWLETWGSDNEAAPPLCHT